MSAEGQSEDRVQVTWSEVTNQRPAENISLARCKSIPDSDLLLVSAPGERSRIETCKPRGENREISLSLLLCIHPSHLHWPSYDCYSVWSRMSASLSVCIHPKTECHPLFVCSVNHIINMRQILDWDSIIPQLLSRAKHWVISSWITWLPTSRHSQVCSHVPIIRSMSLITHLDLTQAKVRLKWECQCRQCLPFFKNQQATFSIVPEMMQL